MYSIWKVEPNIRTISLFLVLFIFCFKASCFDFRIAILRNSLSHFRRTTLNLAELQQMGTRSLTTDLSKCWIKFLNDGKTSEFLVKLYNLHSLCTEDKNEFHRCTEEMLLSYTSALDSSDVKVAVGCIKAVKGVQLKNSAKEPVYNLLRASTVIGKRLIKFRTEQDKVRLLK